MDFLCDRRHDWRHHGPRSGCGDKPQRITGWCIPYGFLQRPLGLHAQFILVERSRCDEKKLHGCLHRNHLW